MKCKQVVNAISIVFAFFLSFGSLSRASGEIFHVGYFPAEPHVMKGSGEKIEGVAVEYFERIANEMGFVELKFSRFPLKRLLIELEQNKMDMALIFAKNPERAVKFVYPKHPFFITRPSIAVNSQSPLTCVSSVEELLHFSIQESAGAYRSPFIRDQRLKIEPLHGSNYSIRCFAKLLSKRIDACYRPDHYPFEFDVKKEMYLHKIRIISLPEPPIGIYSVFSKQSAEKYLKPYETALERVKKEISYEELFKKFMGRQKTP